MELRHNWFTWETITARLEREGKLDEADILITTTARREELYNDIVKLSSSIEELVILAYYSGRGLGYLQGYKEGTGAKRPQEYVS